jgi:hypothetical protein
MMTNHGILGYLSRQTHMGAGQNNSTPKRMVLYCIVRMDQCCGSLDGTHKNHINKVLECKTVATSAPEKPCFEIGSKSFWCPMFSYCGHLKHTTILWPFVVVILWSYCGQGLPIMPWDKHRTWRRNRMLEPYILTNINGLVWKSSPDTPLFHGAKKITWRAVEIFPTKP